MELDNQKSGEPAGRCRHQVGRRIPYACALMLIWSTGCAAFHPVRGIPVQELDIAACSMHSNRSGRGTIDLSLLRQPRPDTHRIDSGDVLGIYVEGVLGRDTDVPPISTPPTEQFRPAVGYPIHVRGDGSIHLPMIPPVYVRGFTLNEVEYAVRSAYTGARGVLRPGNDRIIVNLQRPRTSRVLVIRQEAGNPLGNRGASQSVNFESDKRGTGRIVSLAAYENDVLHALAETGGLPGLDAENAIYVIRSPRAAVLHPATVSGARPADFVRSPISTATHQIHRPAENAAELPPDAIWPSVSNPNGAWRTSPDAGTSADSSAAGVFGHTQLTGGTRQVPQAPDSHATGIPGGSLPEYVRNAAAAGSQIIRIPLRINEHESLPFGPEDIVLQDGDIVFIESRHDDFFFTGGLLGNAQIVLPRDYDLDLFGAIALAEQHGDGPYPTPALGGVSVLNQDVTVGASRVVVHRQLPGGGRIAIEVDLYRALEEPSENLIIQPGDRIFLRYSCSEAIMAFIERHLLEGAVIGGASSMTFGN